MRPLIRSGGKTIQGPQAVTEAPVDGKQYVRKNGEWSETNFTQEEKAKLVGISEEATKNRADSENADKVHAHTMAQVAGLDAALADKASNTDPRLTNSREWTASTVSQAEAEAGTATTARKWTAQRVRQAIVAWFNGVSGALGRTILSRTTADQVRGDIGLGTAATRGVTTSSTDTTADRLLKVGDFGVGSIVTLPAETDLNTFVINGTYEVNNAVNRPSGAAGWGYLRVSRHSNPNGHCYQEWTEFSNNARAYYRVQSAGTWGTWRELISTGNILTTTTGTSTQFPMTQKAVTDGLNTKANASTQVIAGTGLSGGGTLAANRTLNVTYGTAAGTAAQGDDSRLSNSREWTATTVSEAEAQAGTATTRRAWTAQRVRQAINAWWGTIGTTFGKTLLGSDDATAARGSLGLGTAAARDVGTDAGNVMEVGAFGLGVDIPAEVPSNDLNNAAKSGFYTIHNSAENKPTEDGGSLTVSARNPTMCLQIFQQAGPPRRTCLRLKAAGIWYDWVEVQTTGNILTSTGQSAKYPMTQKAVTDAINARGFEDASGILTVASGALSNDMSSFLSLKTKAEIIAWLAD